MPGINQTPTRKRNPLPGEPGGTVERVDESNNMPAYKELNSYSPVSLMNTMTNSNLKVGMISALGGALIAAGSMVLGSYISSNGGNGDYNPSRIEEQRPSGYEGKSIAVGTGASQAAKQEGGLEKKVSDNSESLDNTSTGEKKVNVYEYSIPGAGNISLKEGERPVPSQYGEALNSLAMTKDAWCGDSYDFAMKYATGEGKIGKLINQEGYNSVSDFKEGLRNLRNNKNCS